MHIISPAFQPFYKLLPFATHEASPGSRIRRAGPSWFPGSSWWERVIGTSSNSHRSRSRNVHPSTTSQRRTSARVDSTVSRFSLISAIACCAWRLIGAGASSVTRFPHADRPRRSPSQPSPAPQPQRPALVPV